MPGRVYTQLLELANERFGYLTPDDARAMGVDPLRLQDLARRGLAERVAHGVYRIELVPRTALDQYMEATLWPQGVKGVLCHETALDLHDLCDVNPAKIHLTLPIHHRVRRAVPKVYVLHHRDLEDADVALHEGIPIATPYRAILDGIEAHLGPRLLDQAIETAAARGLLRREQLADVRQRLREPIPAQHRPMADARRTARSTQRLAGRRPLSGGSPLSRASLGIVLLMSNQLALTIVFEPGEDGWVIASIPEVAGVFSQGHTRAEARANVIDALRLMLSPEPAGDDDRREREQLHLTIAA